MSGRIKNDEKSDNSMDMKEMKLIFQMKKYLSVV